MTMMTLQEWLDADEYMWGRGAASRLASRAGISRSTLYRVMRGYQPSRRTDERLREATDGQASW